MGEPWVPPRWVGELWLVLEEVAPDGPATEAERNPVDECLASLLLNPVPPGRFALFTSLLWEALAAGAGLCPTGGEVRGMGGTRRRRGLVGEP